MIDGEVLNHGYCRNVARFYTDKQINDMTKVSCCPSNKLTKEVVNTMVAVVYQSYNCDSGRKRAFYTQGVLKRDFVYYPLHLTIK